MILPESDGLACTRVTHMLNRRPYGPAGMALRPKRCPRIMAANEKTVDSTVDTTMKDFRVSIYWNC